MCSQNLIQPGLHDVIIGSLPPFLILSKSSVPSSIIVRSAAVLVSKILSAPSLLIAVTILPVGREPIGIPNASPIEKRTAGAVWNITYLSGSAIAFHTSSISLFSVSAPVGQTAIH